MPLSDVLQIAADDLSIVEAAFICLKRKSDYQFCEGQHCGRLVPTSIGRCPAHPDQNLRMHKRALKALELRQVGMTFERIGDELGVTKERARQIFMRGERHLRHYGSLDTFRSRVQHLETWGSLGG